MATDHVAIGWWNTALAPLAKLRAEADEAAIAFAESIIFHLLNRERLDCLCLGEVNGALLARFRRAAGAEFDLRDCSGPDGRLRHDCGLIYRRSAIEIVAVKRIYRSYAEHDLRLAQHLLLRLNQDSELHLFMVHWSSRLHLHDGSAIRDQLGMGMAEALVSLKRDYVDRIAILVIGDFNDEPFSQSMAGHLLALREREKVQQSDRFLYNPFWRLMGESQPLSPGGRPKSHAGTYYRPSPAENRWASFDQVLVSSGLLGEFGWQLDESRTRVLHYPELGDKVLISNRGRLFDHFPIMTAIYRDTPRKEISK